MRTPVHRSHALFLSPMRWQKTLGLLFSQSRQLDCSGQRNVNLPKCPLTHQQVMQRGLTASEGGLGSS